MNSALRSSVFEIVILVLCIAWAVIFSASLLHPGKNVSAWQVVNATTADVRQS